MKPSRQDPDFPKRKTAVKLARFVKLHEHNLSQKTEIIIEHFRNQVKHCMGGRAKAMLVASSRLHAVRYMNAFNDYIAAHGYDDVRPLVAFSATVVDPDTTRISAKLSKSAFCTRSSTPSTSRPKLRDLGGAQPSIPCDRRRCRTRSRSDGMADETSQRMPVALPTNVRRPRAVARHLLGITDIAVFVDGYNFVFSLWPESKDNIGVARRRLERRLRHIAVRDSLDTTIVWDGVRDSYGVPLRRRPHRADEGGESVVFSPVGYEADDTIVHSCEMLPPTRRS